MNLTLKDEYDFYCSEVGEIIGPEVWRVRNYLANSGQ